MQLSSPDHSLKGKFLIAMPGMGDPRFARSVIYLCDHGPKGAMGLIINKTTSEVTFDGLLEQLEIPAMPGLPMLPVHVGGPVETSRGFVLHSDDVEPDETTLEIGDGIAMTASLDMLRAIAKGEGPEKALFALGYSGWGEGQLEEEIAQNGWLTGEASSEVIFNEDDDAKWASALRMMGVEALALSGAAGRA